MTKRCRPVFAYLNTWIKPEDAGDDLPLLHRLAIVYLMLPVVVWLVGWFEWWFGIPASVLLMLAFWQALSGSWRLRLGPATVALLLVALGWVMTTGAGGLLDHYNADWQVHRSKLLDLSRYPWPTYLPHPLVPHLPDQTEHLLRYYLGWYMVPGLIALMFGPAALNWAVPLWTWIGVALILLLFTRRHQGWRIFLAAAVVICFSGMDVLRVILFEGWTWIDLRVDWQGWPGIDVGIDHIEWYYWDILTQYSSNMTALQWAPQHFISACLYALLLLNLRRQPRFLAISGILLAASPFWSVFVALGLLPLLAVLFFSNGIRPFLRWQNLILSWPLAGLVVLYLTSGSVDFPHGWLMEGDDWSMILKWSALFYLTEFLLIAGLLYLLCPGLRREPFFVVSIGTLLFLPWFRYGVYNDLVMRASLPSLFLLCYWCADVLARQRVDPGWKRRLALVGLVIALLVGSVTAFIEVTRAIRTVRFFDYAQATHSLQRNFEPWEQFYYYTFDQPEVLRWLLRDSDGTIQTYEKGDLLARAGFDVYRCQNHLVYVKEQCNADDRKSRLQINSIPVNRADLPPHLRVLGFQESTVRGFHKIGNACGVAWKLPSYDLAGIRTRQRFRDEGTWEIEMTFGAEGSVHVVNRNEKDFRADYDTIASNDPIIRADFDVYLHENELIYVKDPCRLTSGKRVFLHLIPEDVNDLIGPATKGFDETSFRFVRRAVKFDGKCMATIPLPDYAIAGIRTGQPANDGSIAWEAEFSVSRSPRPP